MINAKQDKRNTHNTEKVSSSSKTDYSKDGLYPYILILDLMKVPAIGNLRCSKKDKIDNNKQCVLTTIDKTTGPFIIHWRSLSLIQQL